MQQSVPGQQRKPPRSKAKLKGEKPTEEIVLPTIVASLKKPNGRPRKLYTIEEEMDAWIAAHDGTSHLHDALRVGFDVSIPRVFIGLSKRAATGEPISAKLILEWWDKWKKEDVARTLNVTPDSKSSAAWVSAAIDPTGDLGLTEKVAPETLVSNADNKEGMHAGTTENIEQKSDEHES